MANSRARNVEIKVLVDDKQARQHLKSIDDATGKTAKGFGGITGAMKVMAGSFSAGVIVSALGDVITSASDLEESINGVRKVFGPAADGILDLGERAAEAFGLSNKEFNEFAIGFANFADDISAGSGQPVVDVIDTLAGRISDFASVMNLDIPDAVAKFRSGLAGEAEPLRNFGIDLSETAVSAHAMAEGIHDGAGEMTQSEKVYARYSLLLQETEEMAGDFKDTSDDLANSQRILTAKTEDLKAALGEALLPVVEDATGAMADLATIFDALIEKGSELGGDQSSALGGVVQSLADMIPMVGPAIRGWQIATDVWDKAADVLSDTEEAEKDVTSQTAKLSRQMDVNRHRTSDAAEAIRDFGDAADEAADPALDLIGSVRRLREAQQKYTDALIKHGPKSDDAKDAALELAEAQGDADAAARTFSQEGGPKSIDALRQMARRAGLSEDAIADLISEIERLNRTPVGRVGSDITGRSGDNRQEFASGGVVQGTPGSAQTITAHAGEVVLTAAQAAGGGAGPLVVQVVLDGRVIAESVKPHFVRDNRSGRSWS